MMRRILHHVHNNQKKRSKWQQCFAWWICCWVPMMAVAFPLLGHYEFPPSFNVKPFCYPGTTNHPRRVLLLPSSSLATTTTTQLSLSSSSSSASQSPLWSPNNTDNNHNATKSTTIQGKTKNDAPNNNTAAQVTAKNQTQSTNKMNASNITTNPPTATTANNNNIKIIEGIGGKGGVVYDVNRLKRNLLQETMTAYKEELFELLTSTTTSTSNSAVVEKLGALVQASPVRTTTDSNLLDGQDDWVLAFRSRYPTTVASLVLYNDDDFDSNNNPQFNARYNFLWNEDAGMSSLLMSSTKNNNKKKKNLANKNKLKDLVFTTRKRTFRLEELDDEEDAYIMDTTYLLGGLLTRMEWFDIVGLTRSSLQLIPTLTQWSVLGRQQQQHHHHNNNNNDNDDNDNNNNNNNKPSDKKKQQQHSKNNRSTNKSYQRKPFSVQIIYLDNDLCILTEDDGPDSPFMVYTRNSAYVSAYQSLRRKFKILRTSVASTLAWPFRHQWWHKFRPNAADAADDPILKEIIQNNPQTKAAKKLRVLRLGNVRPDDEDESWESETDPFVHLSADERQRLLKAMSVQEVEEAAETYRNARNRFQFLRRFLRRFRRNKRSFKAPPQAWQRPAKTRTNNNKSKKKK